ncbi:hypothetical protein OROGR_002841 [Orobanche gracilis]
MSDNGSVPSPLLKDSDHLFGPSEIGPKFAYEAGIRRKIISNNDMFPEWAGYIRRLRACELEEGGSLCNHILEMMNYMNKLEYLDTNFDRNLAVPLLLRSLPDSYNDLLWKNHCEDKSKTWIEIIISSGGMRKTRSPRKKSLKKKRGRRKEKKSTTPLIPKSEAPKEESLALGETLGMGRENARRTLKSQWVLQVDNQTILPLLTLNTRCDSHTWFVLQGL